MTMARMRPISTLRAHTDEVRDEFKAGVDRITEASETAAVTVTLCAVLATVALVVALAVSLKAEGVKPPWN